MALTGNPPKDNYLDLLYLDNANAGLHATTVAPLKDGGDNVSLLGLSQAEIEFTGILSATVANGVVLDAGVYLESDRVIVDSVRDSTTPLTRGLFFYTGDPEGVLTASIGSIIARRDGGVGTTLYLKESGIGPTGWTPVKVITDFLELDNMPGAYAAGQFVKVNAGGTALEFSTAGGLVESPVGSAEGEVFYYDGSDWANLGVGTDGYVLTTHGAAAAPTWEVAASGLPSGAQGEVLYYGGATWDALAVGTDGYVLTSHGAAADPTWEEASGGVSTLIALTDTPVGYDSPYNILNSTGSAANWNTLDNIAYNISTGAPSTDDVLSWNGTVLEWVTATAGSTFQALTDTPASPAMASAGLAFVRVNSGGTALEYHVEDYIVEPGEQDHGTLLMVAFSGEYASFAPGTEGKVLTSHGVAALTWETPGTGVTSFFDLDEVTPIDFSDAALQHVAVNAGGDALVFIDPPTGGAGGGKEYTVAEYDTGDTFGGKAVYAILLEFGAGPVSTTKSVASGLAANDVFTVIDLQVSVNDITTGWAYTQADMEFTYNKTDFKIYGTSTTDMSANSYTVLLKYIKEPVVMSGSYPHIVATVSGGPWGGLANGVHVIHPSSYNFTYSGTYSAASNLHFDWNYTQASPYEFYKLKMKVDFTGTTRESYVTLYTSSTGYAPSSWQTSSPTGVYAKGIGPGDRTFKAYTQGGKTLTIARTSDYPLSPATYTV